MMREDLKEKLIMFKRKELRSSLIYKASKKLGAHLEIIAMVPWKDADGNYLYKPLVRLTKNNKQAFVLGATTDKTSFLGIKLAVNKIVTNYLLQSAGIPVPQQKEIKNKKDLQAALKQFGKIVLKPYASRCGKGLISDISDFDEAFNHFQKIKEKYRIVIAEEQVEGNDYRVLVIDNKVVAVLQRIPPFVVGDGKNTIYELIRKENNSSLRKEGKVLKPIRLGPHIDAYLAKNNLALNSVPAKNQKIQLSRVSNISAGGMGINVTDKIHKRNKELAIAAVKILGLDVAGIDIIASSIEQPIDKIGGKIIEINGGPDLKIHYYPFKGKSINPVEAIIKMVLKI